MTIIAAMSIVMQIKVIAIVLGIVRLKGIAAMVFVM